MSFLVPCRGVQKLPHDKCNRSITPRVNAPQAVNV